MCDGERARPMPEASFVPCGFHTSGILSARIVTAMAHLGENCMVCRAAILTPYPSAFVGAMARPRQFFVVCIEAAPLACDGGRGFEGVPRKEAWPCREICNRPPATSGPIILLRSSSRRWHREGRTCRNAQRSNECMCQSPVYHQKYVDAAPPPRRIFNSPAHRGAGNIAAMPRRQSRRPSFVVIFFSPIIAYNERVYNACELAIAHIVGNRKIYYTVGVPGAFCIAFGHHIFSSACLPSCALLSRPWPANRGALPRAKGRAHFIHARRVRWRGFGTARSGDVAIRSSRRRARPKRA